MKTYPPSPPPPRTPPRPTQYVHVLFVTFTVDGSSRDVNQPSALVSERFETFLPERLSQGLHLVERLVHPHPLGAGHLLHVVPHQLLFGHVLAIGVFGRRFSHRSVPVSSVLCIHSVSGGQELAGGGQQDGQDGQLVQTVL